MGMLYTLIFIIFELFLCYIIVIGSIMAVSSSNPHAPNKATRFVGICIQRLGCGLRANFTLRNVIKHIGK